MHGRLFICILLIVFGIFSYIPALAEEISLQTVNAESLNWSDEENQAFSSMIHSFKSYESLLGDVYEYGDYHIAVHGESFQEAMNYLDTGFEAELAASIIEAYMQQVPEIQKMAVIPCDGIPTLSENDNEAVSCSHPDENTIIFQRSYEDCYNQGDSYLFTVTLHHSAQGWRIKALSLEEQ
ncbi:MAG: hypothetical protein ABFD18_05010 [Syntrophomonas sp.]